jgi:hypothetical protein
MFLFALFNKLSFLFAPVHLPLDRDYSYQARRREAERIRKSAEHLFLPRLQAWNATASSKPTPVRAVMRFPVNGVSPRTRGTASPARR